MNKKLKCVDAIKVNYLSASSFNSLSERIGLGVGAHSALSTAFGIVSDQLQIEGLTG